MLHPIHNRHHSHLETEKYKADFDLQTLITEQRAHPDWGAFATRLQDNGGFEFPRSGAGDDNAHPPIHPTKMIPLDQLQGDERKLYELVTRHFLAVCSKVSAGPHRPPH